MEKTLWWFVIHPWQGIEALRGLKVCGNESVYKPHGRSALVSCLPQTLRATTQLPLQLMPATAEPKPLTANWVTPTDVQAGTSENDNQDPVSASASQISQDAGAAPFLGHTPLQLQNP